MSDVPPQSYQAHRRIHPLYHLVTVPILSINVIVTIVLAVRNFSWLALWNVFVASALILLAVIVRVYATRNQDRVIRAEESARMWRVLPPELRPRIAELTASQMVALRFAPDEELAELTSAVLSGEVRGRTGIKQRIRNWREDRQRV